jgi:hypothetical protein
MPLFAHDSDGELSAVLQDIEPSRMIYALEQQPAITPIILCGNPNHFLNIFLLRFRH